jgi:hypothetical protein
VRTGCVSDPLLDIEHSPFDVRLQLGTLFDAKFVAREGTTDIGFLPVQSFSVGMVVDIVQLRPYRQLGPGALRFFSTSASVIIIIIGSTGHS